MERIEVYQYEDIRQDIPLSSGIGFREIDSNRNALFPEDKSGKTLDSLAESIVKSGYLSLSNQVDQRCDISHILDTPVVRKTKGLGEVEFDDLVHKIAKEYFKIHNL
ncbi:MAG: hypothetical protein WC979_08200 [Candidatus Pacearchaeota archaeon]|jgi:hypothetical protein